MKNLGRNVCAVMLLLIGAEAAAQELPSEVDSNQYARSMSQVAGKRSDGMYRYFENGEDKPFDGVLYARYENGNYRSWQEYKQGIGEGHWINFYENGKMKEWGTYRQNKVEGPIRKYNEKGELTAMGNYRNWRVRVGVWKYFNESGELEKVENYGDEGDYRDVEEFYALGQISKEWYEQIKAENRNHN